VESFFSSPPVTIAAAVARENIAILSRTLRLHTSFVLPPDVVAAAGFFVTAVTFLGPSESVSESVLPIEDAGRHSAAAVIELYDDLIATVGRPLPPRSGSWTDVKSVTVVPLVRRSSVNKQRNRTLTIESKCPFFYFDKS